jgi:hypothetical protein
LLGYSPAVLVEPQTGSAVTKPSTGHIQKHLMEPDEDGIPTRDCCDSCECSNAELFFCAVCPCMLCSDCWETQIAHKKNKIAFGGIPHEKTQPLVARRLQTVFFNRHDEVTFQKLHEKDEDTIWFGEFSGETCASVTFIFTNFRS